MIDPRIKNIFFDSCVVVSPDHTDQESKCANILFNDKELIIILANSNVKELNHKNTPSKIQTKAKSMIRTLSLEHTQEEDEEKKKILDIMAGNGCRKNMEQDANHFSEAKKYGGYFITVDQGILKKRDKIYDEFGLSSPIMKPSELLTLLKECRQDMPRVDNLNL